MFLQKLEIQGFKSFAQKTVLEFPERSNLNKDFKSINAVVGPNGSGKSNVVDAIRWVMGEQSYKLLRCKRSDDIIFGGSQTKARQGFAEVSLYLNNEDGQAPIDLTEIVITRRVYRDGEGEYLINKKKVKLFDILMLLAKSSFGQKSYGIIGQGMVDYIINISPTERKQFFDEATGVKQYQIKRDQSVNKLKRSQDNLEQTNQILKELEPRLRLLTRQVKKLEQRKEVEIKLKGLQNKYYGKVWLDLQNKKDKISEEYKLKADLEKEANSKVLKLQEDLAKLAKEESRKDIFNNLQKDYNKLITEKNDYLQELTVLRGKMDLEYVKVGKQDLSWLENKKVELGKRLEEIRESLHNVENRLVQKKSFLTDNEKELLEANNEVVVLNNNLQALKEEIIDLKNNNFRLNKNQQAVQSILKQGSYIKGIYGTVAELAKVDDIYMTALAVAAGGRLSAVVVQDESVAKKCIDYLKEHKLGVVTFFPLNKINGFRIRKETKQLLEKNGAIGFAQELLSFEPKFKNIFSYVFSDTVIVDKLDHALNIGLGQVRMVTLDGELMERSGSVRGGYQKKDNFKLLFKKQKTIDYLSDKLSEENILKSKLDDWQRKKEELINDINNLKIEIQVTETKQKGLINDSKELEKEKNKIIEELTSHKISDNDKSGFLKNLESKRVEVEKNLKEVEEKVVLVRNKVDQFNLQEEKKKKEVFKLQDELQKYQDDLRQVVSQVNELKISLARLETKEEDVLQDIKHDLGVEFDLKTLRKDEEFNSEAVLFSINKLKNNLEMIGGIDPEVIEEHTEVQERYQFLNQQNLDLEKAITDLNKIVKELDQVIEKQFSASFKKINQAFQGYFNKIFGGGKAKLVLNREETRLRQGFGGQERGGKKEDGLQSEIKLEETSEEEEKKKNIKLGVDIMASPPNKKITNIASLSGGERTMTSLALICAIISCNPSPFIVLDEVEAALDENNSQKFANILRELSENTQFVIISHNRVTMHVADVLYGVAMADDGVSKVLSLNLKDAEKSVT